MRRVERLFQALTAGDVMSRAVAVPHGMSVVTAARLLAEQQVRVAPVTDGPGRCVGVLSAEDVLRWAAGGGQAGKEREVLTSCVWCDWQVVNAEATQRDEVRHHMTPDPLLVTPDTHLVDTAGALLGLHRRPVVVVDERRQRPLGVVSSTDVLAALASVERRPEEEPPTIASTGRRSLLRRSVQPSGRA